MKLEWLAAVLRPADIAPARHRSNAEYDSQPHVRLAAAILGDQLRTPSIFDEPHEVGEFRSPEEFLVDLAVGTFVASTILESTFELVQRVQDDDLDIAVSCALTLIAATALAELEDMESCESLLRFVLERIHTRDAPHLLLRACILQQLSLRKRDWGDEDTSYSYEVNEIVKTVEIDNFPLYPVNEDIDSRNTTKHILAALQESAWSLRRIGTTSILEPNNPYPLNWKDIAKADRSEEFLLIDETRADVYSEYIQSIFLQEFGDHTIRFGARHQDLFHVNLRNELYGSGYVRSSRKELAVFRLVLSTQNPISVDSADCLRLLRYIGADDVLDLALERVRYAGPLAGLSKDARQVIARRLTPGAVRSSDLAVIAAAADLLTEPEVRMALDSVLDLLELGSPHNEAGRWTAQFKREEKTLRTAASLANSIESAGEILARLLANVSTKKYDTALDLAYARIVYFLEWPGPGEPGVDSWAEWLKVSGEWKYTRDAVQAKLQAPRVGEGFTVSRLADVEAVATDMIFDHPVAQQIVDESAKLLLESFDRIRTSSRIGQYSSGGPEPSELAVILATRGSDTLWEPLVEFLNDAVVPRQYKSPALERMAGPGIRLPDGIAALFRAQSVTLAGTKDPMPIGGEPYGPYPAALRFLGRHHLLSESDLLLSLSQLAGASDVRLRIAAAKTVAVLADTWSTPWMISLALQLSYSSHPNIRGYVANALAIMATSSHSGDVANAAIARLTSLLKSDGLIVPLLGIRGMRVNRDAALDPPLAETLQYLAAEHPAKNVRAEASELLRTTGLV